MLPSGNQANQNTERKIFRLMKLEHSHILNNQNSNLDSRKVKKKSRQKDKRQPSARINSENPLFENNKQLNSARVSESLRRKKKIFESTLRELNI